MIRLILLLAGAAWCGELPQSSQTSYASNSECMEIKAPNLRMRCLRAVEEGKVFGVDSTTLALAGSGEGQLVGPEAQAAIDRKKERNIAESIDRLTNSIWFMFSASIGLAVAVLVIGS